MIMLDMTSLLAGQESWLVSEFYFVLGVVINYHTVWALQNTSEGVGVLKEINWLNKNNGTFGLILWSIDK